MIECACQIVVESRDRGKSACVDDPCFTLQMIVPDVNQAWRMVCLGGCFSRKNICVTFVFIK